MNPGGARAKGHEGERELAKILGKALGIDCYRNIEQVRSGGHDLMGIPGIALEVKRQEALDLRKWWEQAVQQAREESMRSGLYHAPVLAYRQNRKPWTFVVALHEVFTVDEPRSFELTASLSLLGFLAWYSRKFSHLL